MKPLHALIIEDSEADAELQRIVHRHGGQIRGDGVPAAKALHFISHYPANYLSWKKQLAGW